MNIKSMNLAKYVEQRNAIRKLFNQRPLSLNNARDRQQLANDIDSALSPENLTCDGELPGSVALSRFRMLKRVAQELQKLDPAVKFYEFA